MVEFKRLTAEHGLSAPLYRRVRIGTRDRLDKCAWDAVPGVLAILSARIPDGASWLGCVRGRARAYVVGALDGSQGRILDIGVAPDLRRAGIAGELLHRAANSLSAMGATQVESLIDEHNLPSRALHRSQGFRQRVGTYSTWRRRK